MQCTWFITLTFLFYELFPFVKIFCLDIISNSIEGIAMKLNTLAPLQNYYLFSILLSYFPLLRHLVWRIFYKLQKFLHCNSIHLKRALRKVVQCTWFMILKSWWGTMYCIAILASCFDSKAPDLGMGNILFSSAVDLTHFLRLW